MNARQAAYLSLTSLMTKGKYSNIELDNMISKYSLSGNEKALYTVLVYGVLERQLTLDYFISSLSNVPLEKIDINSKVAIQIGLYQIFYLSGTPDFASVNESVELIKWAYNTKEGASKFVNAILREAIRKKDKLLSFSSITDKTEYLKIKYSVNEFLINKLINQYGYETCEKILSSTFSHPKITLRVNTLKISKEDFMKKLNDDGISCSQSSLADESLTLDSRVPYEVLKKYDSLFFVQDLSSQFCSHVVSPKPYETVLDACACPGGKSFNMAMLMDNKGKIVSRDLHKNKLSLVEKSALSLGIDIIETQEGSSSLDLGNVMYDKILCDVPCSGFGVMAKKPEIRYKKEEDIIKLPQIQYSILFYIVFQVF